jgi:hypothetical protein
MAGQKSLAQNNFMDSISEFEFSNHHTRDYNNRRSNDSSCSAAYSTKQLESFNRSTSSIRNAARRQELIRIDRENNRWVGFTALSEKLI